VRRDGGNKCAARIAAVTAKVTAEQATAHLLLDLVLRFFCRTKRKIRVMNLKV
jgi:hypothetical protein